MSIAHRRRVPIVHLTARARAPYRPFDDFEVAQWTWTRLREAFPCTYAAGFMPNHPHVLAEVDSPDRARTRLARILGQMGRWVDVVWEPVPPPSLIVGREKLARNVRYVGLNAPRGGIVGDPLESWWCTHRDVMGAALDPWVTAGSLARALGQPLGGFAERHHRYVSSDPCVCVTGTPPPRLAPPSEIPRVPLDLVLRAACAAGRAQPRALTRRGPVRRLAIWLAYHQGWTSDAQLALALNMTPSAVRKAARCVDSQALDIARRCLADARLRLSTPNAPFWGSQARQGRLSGPSSPNWGTRPGQVGGAPWRGQ